MTLALAHSHVVPAFNGLYYATIATIRSIYRWQDAIEDQQEARVALHTRAALVPAIVERTKAVHPYDVPCVIALPILAGNPDYLAWIEHETDAAEP